MADSPFDKCLRQIFNRYVEKYLETEIKDKKQGLKSGKGKDKTVFLLSNKIDKIQIA